MSFTHLLRWRAVGWMNGLAQADVARRLMCLVVLFSDFGIKYQSEDSVSRRPVPGRPRATNTCRRPFFQLFRHEGEEPLLCRSSLQTTFSSIRKKNLRYYGGKSSSQCRSVCKKTSCVRSPQRTTAKEPLMLGKRTCFWTQQQWASVLFTDESRFSNGE
ncbi:paired domain-containing protein [Trichonephila clavipes]|nr:paired domain-containing protein [Trichonephila clavipes]